MDAALLSFPESPFPQQGLNQQPACGQTSPSVLVGRIASAGTEDTPCAVLLPDGLFTARTAASCLLAPAAGDEVLVSTLADGRAFILAVLVRGTSLPRLDLPEGATLHCPGDLSLATDGRLEIRSTEASLSSGELGIRAADIHASAQNAQLSVCRLKVFAETVRHTFKNLTATIGRCLRLVDHDETRAQNSRLAVSGDAVTQAGAITQLAGTSVRVDAPSVHIA